MTFLEMAEEVLKLNKEPMTAREIWNFAVHRGLSTKLNHTKSNVPTPANSLSTVLLRIEDKQTSPIVLVSSSPKKYYLRNAEYKDVSNNLFSEIEYSNDAGISATVVSKTSTHISMDKNKHYVYVLTNPSFPKFVKIGYTQDVESRLKSLNTAVPYRFKIYALFEVNQKDLDKKIHGVIDSVQKDYRAHEFIEGKEYKSEFYALEPDHACEIISKVLAIMDCNVKTRQQDISGKVKAKPISFKKLGLIGEELEFYNDPSIKVKVIDDRQVIYKGKPYKLSPLYCVITGEDKPIQGPKYFRYKGELLTDMRARLGV